MTQLTARRRVGTTMVLVVDDKGQLRKYGAGWQFRVDWTTARLTTLRVAVYGSYLHIGY